MVNEYDEAKLTKAEFQSPSGVGVVCTPVMKATRNVISNAFQSPNGVGVVCTEEMTEMTDELCKSFNHLTVLGWFVHLKEKIFNTEVFEFQSPNGVGVVCTPDAELEVLSIKVSIT